MKKTFVKISALSIAMVVLATSCSKTGPTGPAGANGANGSAGPNLSGSLEGVVSLYDVSGSKVVSTTALAGDTIVLTNNSNGTAWKTATSTTGSYTFANITTGTYSMTVTKPGYGSVIAQGIQFAGGGNADRNFALGAIPTTGVSSVVAVDTTYASTGVNYIKIRGGVTATSGGSTVIVFVSLPYLSYGSTTVGNFSASYTVAVAPGTSAYKILIPTADMYNYGFASGNSAYFATCILGGTTSTSSYADWATGQTVYTALSPSTVATTTVQ
jgi:hypothetical protein